MKAGKLRDQVTIEYYDTETLNAYGEFTPTWKTYSTVFAQVKSISGREFYQVEMVKSVVDYNITIRYLTGVTPKMRVKWTHMSTTVYMEIVAVLADDINAIYQILKCKLNG